MSSRQKRDWLDWLLLAVVGFAVLGLAFSWAERHLVVGQELAKVVHGIDSWWQDSPESPLTECQRDLQVTAEGTKMLALEVNRLLLERARECSI